MGAGDEEQRIADVLGVGGATRPPKSKSVGDGNTKDAKKQPGDLKERAALQNHARIGRQGV